MADQNPEDVIRDAYSRAKNPEEKALVEQAAKRFKVNLNPPGMMDRVLKEGGNAVSRIGSNLVGGVQNLWGMAKDVGQGIVGNDAETLGAGKDFLQRTGLPQNLDNLKQLLNYRNTPNAGDVLESGAGSIPLLGGLLKSAVHEGRQGNYGNAIGDLLTLKGVPEGTGALTDFATKGAEGLGKGLYESALPHGKDLSPLDIKAMRREGWQSGIPMTEAGASKAGALASQATGNVDAIINQDPSRPVPTSDVLQPLLQLGDRYKNSNFPQMSDPVFEAASDIQNQLGPSQTGLRTNELKRNNNSLLRDEQFKDNAAPTGQKQIIKTTLEGQRNAINSTYPEAGPENLRAHSLIQLQDAASQASKAPLLQGGLASQGLNLGVLALMHQIYPHLTLPAISLMALREAGKNPSFASRAGLSVKGFASGGVNRLGQLPGYTGYLKNENNPQDPNNK